MFNKKRQWGPTPRYPLVEEYYLEQKEFTLIAGPCSVESRDQIFECARIAKQQGATHLRGGVFRAGTYPSDNFGLKVDMAEAQMEAAIENGLKNIMEVLSYEPTEFEIFKNLAHSFQIGSRSMQNYTLLKKVAEAGKPVFLKRNQGSTIDEWLGAAEYLLKYARDWPEIYLIERGSSTFMDHVRWDLSISAIAAVQKITDIPVIVDASHGTGRCDLVENLTLAGVAAGADGCLIEFHPEPRNSLSDAEQAISIEEFKTITKKIKKIRSAI